MDYIKLDKAPVWVLQYPTCSACTVDLDTDGDGWLCPQCGSIWDMRANDGDVGELYESWSGDTLSGPSLTSRARRVPAASHARGRGPSGW